MIALLISLFLASSSFAQNNQPEVIPVELKAAYIPVGFDNNDRIQVVVEGWFPNSCYKVGPYKVTTEHGEGSLIVRQYAYRYTGMCLEVMTPFNQVIEVGPLPAGSYRVYDGIAGQTLGPLSVQFSTRSEPDEFLYASVTDAVVQIEEGRAKSVALEGVFYNSCFRVHDARVLRENDTVITILPLAEKLEQVGCESGYFPFRKIVPLEPIAKGRYLLHVRSLNGQAVNKVFDVVQ